jgi:uncharacterized protein (DUF1778 family)
MLIYLKLASDQNDLVEEGEAADRIRTNRTRFILTND